MNFGNHVFFYVHLTITTFFLKKLGFTPYKAEEPLQDIELQEKEENDKMHKTMLVRKNPKINGVYYLYT